MPSPKILFDGQVQHVDPKTLKAAPFNPRVNLKADKPAAYAQLKKSLASGVFKPVLVNRRTGRIVAGHQRVEASIDLGFDTVPVLYLDVDEATEKALNVADNATWQGEFNLPMLRDLIGEIDTGEIDLDLTGLDSDYLASLMEWAQPSPGGAESQDDEPLTAVLCECPKCGHSYKHP